MGSSWLRNKEIDGLMIVWRARAMEVGKSGIRVLLKEALGWI
jgi:hypothetical protein